MYDQIADIYLEIFPLNQAFLAFIPAYLGAPGKSVLDLGCGPGDYVDHLSRAGYNATGIDNSEGMIAQAKTSKQGSFYELSFTEIGQLSGFFDCIYCVGNSLSYLPAKEIPPFMLNVQRLLSKGGKFILQVVNWDKVQQTGTANFDVIKLSDGRTFHREYEQVNSQQVLFHTAIRQGKEIQYSWEAPLYPKLHAPMVEAFKAADLAVTGQFGDYQKNLFDPTSSPAFIMTAQKE